MSDAAEKRRLAEWAVKMIWQSAASPIPVEHDPLFNDDRRYIESALDAYAEMVCGEKDDGKRGLRASETDVLNQELRENYRGHVQVTPDQDWRPAFRELVDGVRHGNRYELEQATKLIESLEQELVKLHTYCDDLERDLSARRKAEANGSHD